MAISLFSKSFNINQIINKMKPIFLTFLTLFYALSVFSQTPEVKPIKQPLILPRIEFFGVQFGSAISNFNLHLQTDVNLSDKISLKAILDPSYWDMKKAILQGSSDNLIKMKSAIEYGAGFEFTIKSKYTNTTKKLIIKEEVLSQDYEKKVVKQTYRPVSCEVPVQTRIRGGLQGYRTCVRPKLFNSDERITMSGSESPAIKTSDGTILNEWNPSQVNTMFLYGGLSIKKINYLQVIFKGTKEYGEWRNHRSYFFDVMFAPSISVGIVQRTNGEFDVSESYHKQHLGFRFGQEMLMFNTGKKTGMSVSFEAGMLPGVGKFPVYGKMSIGVGLDFFKKDPVTF